MLHKMLFAVVILVVALGGVALASQTLAIEQQATLILGGAAVIVDVNCGDGESVAQVVVGIRQGTTVGQGFATFNSTGNRQRVGVPVPGAFTAGDAIASAQLLCNTLFEGEALGQSIKILE
jgi:hypothetical protein